MISNLHWPSFKEPPSNKNFHCHKKTRKMFVLAVIDNQIWNGKSVWNQACFVKTGSKDPVKTFVDLVARRVNVREPAKVVVKCEGVGKLQETMTMDSICYSTPKSFPEVHLQFIHPHSEEGILYVPEKRGNFVSQNCQAPMKQRKPRKFRSKYKQTLCR